jgi:hypothetical protein
MTGGASPAARKTTIDELHTLLKADLANETPLRHQSIRPVRWQVARYYICLFAVSNRLVVLR